MGTMRWGDKGTQGRGDVWDMWTLRWGDMGTLRWVDKGTQGHGDTEIGG